MKKFILTLLIIISSISIVYASEYPDITDDIEIRYKWYKEMITGGNSSPLKDIHEEDIIDKNNIKYGQASYWHKDNCNLPSDFYEISIKKNFKYRKVRNARYVLIENFEYNDNIKIYQNNVLLNFEVISNEEKILKIDLKQEYICDTLLFYIENASNYKISLYTDKGFINYIISKEIQNEKIISPDKSWVTDKTEFIIITTEIEYFNNRLISQIEQYNSCSYREIYVYKYDIEKEYYDDNYHLHVEGYIKDTNDYRYYYKGQPIINTVEVTKEKIVKEPQIEYVYIENENNNKKQEIDSSKENNYLQEIKTEVKTKVIEKEIFKIPLKMYIIFFILIVIIVSLIIKLHKKYVD